MLSAGKIPRPSGASSTPARDRRTAPSRVASRPPTYTAPPVAGSSPAATRQAVLFPAPLGPRTARISPARTVRSIPCSTSPPSYPAVTPRSSRETSAPPGGTSPRWLGEFEARGFGGGAPDGSGAEPWQAVARRRASRTGTAAQYPSGSLARANPASPKRITGRCADSVT